ncbi:response regulator receiver modulated diguanylate cyclase/phosphodiesterase with PAS/PAC sensor(s) [Pseudomonas duriflava]|uniref:cyclic-guanylate-specific phosphodiesterase n=1 Tax=Pseudomonas duriflava TaxID=459528 RepID=A0A562QPM8_9PSED|nr:EAL domain-containing protein [Pseudomonas duriflava]TWI58677.1 response regulator receiver modulated diguanylate cyclase/phosphodiesterase with PAS/PAC sensor(s) [Pseudomonas duriflava]
MSPLNCSLRVLLIDDDEDDFFIVRDLLRQAKKSTFGLDWENSAEAGLQAILEQAHDLYLVDYRLGPDSGLELINQALTAGVTKPFILLTGQEDEELDTRAIELGAADYLVKGQFDTRLLVRSIRYAVERNQSTRSLLESENRYRLMFDANPGPMWVFSKETLRFLSVNQAAIDYFGYSHDEFMSMTVLDLRSVEEQERLLRYLETNKNNFLGNLGTDVWSYQHKNGQSLSAQVFTHEFELNGRPCYWVMAVDLTEKQKVRQELIQRELAFRQLLDDTRDALLVIGDDDVLYYANPAAERLLNATQEKLKQHCPLLPKTYNKLYEWTLSTLEGKSVEVEIHCAKTEWEGRQASLLSLRDIAKRKESEKQLRLLQRSVESSYNGVAIADAQLPDLPLIYVNSAFERLTGYSAHEVLGKNCRFLQGSEHEQASLETIRAGLAQQREVRQVLRNYRKDGTLFWNDIFISPIFNDKGELTHFIGVQSDITEQRRYEEELSYNASHDALTGLPNRALLEDRLRQGCQISQRYGRSLAVMYIDLDGFKPINDLYGHDLGDQILVEVAQRMGEQVRPGDTVARMGSDEFIVLLPDLAREEDALQVAERLITDIARPYHVQDIELHITASIGITLSDGRIDQPNQLIQQADRALNKAKQEGRNNYQWYTSDLNPHIGDRVTLRSELKKAIESQSLELYYQPLIDGRSGRVTGLEALLRWRHPEKGFIPPSTFIPVAEDTGQIIPLSLWVLDTACRQMRELCNQGVTGISVAVNISPLHFQRKNFVASVQTVLERYALGAELLELELTESVLMNNTERAIETLRELKGLGLSISIDDFGTGFSSLSYLKRLPIDKVKIDRSFVSEIISDQHDAAITQGIISMAHHLKLKVVAEGVENEPQFAFLRKNHCDIFQGYYFARPMPFNELEAFLRKPILVSDVPPPSTEEVQTLLLLDDEENILRALARVLRRDGYKILMATRAQEAFELLAKNNVQVILSDQRMPEMNGTEFLRRVKDLYPNTMRIVLSGYTDLKSVTDAINQGAIYKFLTKPWDDEQLRQNIAQAFREFANEKE